MKHKSVAKKVVDESGFEYYLIENKRLSEIQKPYPKIEKAYPKTKFGFIRKLKLLIRKLIRN